MGSETFGSHSMGNYRERNRSMKNARAHSRGFTLIASLLMLLLLSGIAIGLLMMVNTEGRVGAADVQNNVAYHAAEGGIEKMANDLATTFANAQSPSASDICALSNLAPTIPGISWSYYNVQPATGVCTGSLANHTVNGVSSEQWGQIGSGPNQNLWAQIIPITMTATAQTLGGMEVSMTRSAEVALIPVFQFGVFCEDDCAFFSTPNLDFNGRLHTNGDLYLGAAGGYTLTFHSKLEAYGNVVTNNLPNTLAANSSANDTGTVYIPTADGNCAFQGGASSTCVAMPDADGSVAGNGGDPPQSSYNTAFNTFSGTVNHEIINGNYGNTTSGQVGTGAKLLSMPFVTGTIHPYELIRRPTSLDTTALSDSREYDMAQILVLLSDDPNDFSSLNLPGSPVRLANITSAEATATGGTVSNPYGIATSTPSNMTALASGSSYATYFAAATNGWLPDTTSCAGAACSLIKTCGSGNSTCQPQYLPPDWLFAPASFAGWSTTQGLQPQYAPVMFAESNTSTANSYPTFALCSTTTNGGSLPTGCNATTPAKPYFVVPNQTNAATWNLIDGYLYVGYVDAAGTWHNVTNEWLQLGFARDVTPPTAIGGNDINPKAILLLQQPADRAGNGGEPDATGIAPACSQWNTGKTSCTGQWSNPLPPEVVADAAVPASPAAPQPYFGVTTGITGTTPAPASGSTLWAKTGQSISMFNWYPINFYDAREGEPRDVTTNQSNDSCTTNGVMNAVEIDVGNLQRWLAGTIGTSGTNVDYVAQNGYVLYFSDRRGMLLNPYPPMEMGQSSAPAAKSGDSGLEDVINSGSSAGTPDGALESPMAGLAVDGVALDSPEDVNLNGHLDNFGTANLGLGQWSGTLNSTTGQVGSAVNQNTQIVAAAPDNPYSSAHRELRHHRTQELGERGAARFEAGGWRARQSAAKPERRRIHGGVGEPGVRSGQLQQQLERHVLYKCDQWQTRSGHDLTRPFSGRGHCRHGHASLQ